MMAYVNQPVAEANPGEPPEPSANNRVIDDHIPQNEGEQYINQTISKEGEQCTQCLEIDDSKSQKEGEKFQPHIRDNMAMKEMYLKKAAYYAELGHEPKFHMFLKLAKFIGHIPKPTVTKSN